MINLVRNKAEFKKLKDTNDDDYVKATPASRISMVWEITQDCWSFVNTKNAQQRLQRNIATFIRKESTGREKDALDARMLRDVYPDFKQ